MQKSAEFQMVLSVLSGSDGMHFADLKGHLDKRMDTPYEKKDLNNLLYKMQTAGLIQRPDHSAIWSICQAKQILRSPDGPKPTLSQPLLPQQPSLEAGTFGQSYGFFHVLQANLVNPIVIPPLTALHIPTLCEPQSPPAGFVWQTRPLDIARCMIVNAPNVRFSELGTVIVPLFNFNQEPVMVYPDEIIAEIYAVQATQLHGR
jgi:hypothetical protein